MTAYTPAQVCEELGIQDSTLRKYSLLLEKEGITFDRHKNNRRIYTETHVITLKRSLELMHNDDITLEKAIKKASKELKAHPVIEKNTVTEKPLQRNDSDITALLVKEIKELKEQLSAQEERQKERDTLFVEALEQMQQEIRSLKEEQQKALVAPEPIEDEVISNHPIEKDVDLTDTPDVTSTDGSSVDNTEVAPEKKKGFFARLFKK